MCASPAALGPCSTMGSTGSPTCAVGAFAFGPAGLDEELDGGVDDEPDGPLVVRVGLGFCSMLSGFNPISRLACAILSSFFWPRDLSLHSSASVTPWISAFFASVHRASRAWHSGPLPRRR